MNPSLLLPVLLVAVLYFVMIRPQQRRMKAREAMMRQADIGDEIATAGGVIGRIVAVEEPGDIVCVEVDSGVELRLQRRAIGEILKASDDDAGDDPSGDDGDSETDSSDKSD